MKNITAKIDIEGYVAEWARCKFFDEESGAARFPATSDIYVTIYDLLSKRPATNPTDKGNFEFCLPSRKVGKSTESYNYISKRAAEIIEDKLKTMFWAELHEYMDREKHIRGTQLKDSAYTFLRRYEIESISEDGILKNYQRWRNKMRRHVKRGYNRKPE